MADFGKRQRRQGQGRRIYTLKRQLPAPDLRKVLARKRFVAAAHITIWICPAAPHRFLAQAFANLGRAQLPFQG